MHVTRTTLMALALVLAAACRPAGDAAKSGESLAEGGATVDGPTGKSGDPVAEEVDNTTPVAEAPAAAAAAIPATYHGRWGLVAADCERGRSDAKGLLRIDATTLRFYESRGTLAEQLPAIATSFAGRFDFTGEGQTWQRDIVLTRTGDKLRRAEDGSEEGPVDLTYTRCPA